jgi:hypothetical protein
MLRETLGPRENALNLTTFKEEKEGTRVIGPIPRPAPQNNNKPLTWSVID